MPNYENKILGCLAGAAIADAMGAATECRSTEQIIEYFGDYVTDFKDPPKDTFGRCNTAGMCTDDFIQGYYILESILDHKGTIDTETMKQAFKRWLDYPFYTNFTGPTTRSAMQSIFGDKRASLQGDLESKEPPVKIVNDGNAKSSNGGAMKIYCVGVLNPGNVDKAIDDAIKVTRFTHNNTLSISGACSVAAAISEALTEESTLKSIFEAGLYGAQKGYDLAYESGADRVAGPSVIARIPLAISIGEKKGSWKPAIGELADIIGNGLHVSEAVPAAFGCIAASQDNAMNAIYAAINMGNDTDTIGIMAGAIMGAYKGFSAFNEDQLNIVNKMNKFDLRATTNQIIDLIGK
ncbi:MAG: ADP-ribosylglycohydrolase family protein [Brevinema sp.]